jgi:hypothetical protein
MIRGCYIVRRSPVLSRLDVLGEIFVLRVDAVNLPWGPAPESHVRPTSGSRWCTHATGSKDGEMSSSRPRTCDWEAPLDRLGNRSPASQGTRLCGGRGMFIGVSLFTNPTSTRKRDMWIALHCG